MFRTHRNLKPSLLKLTLFFLNVKKKNIFVWILVRLKCIKNLG